MAKCWISTGLILFATLIKIGEPSLTCLNGDDLPIPRDTRHVKQCGAHEFCSLEQYITPNGFIQHKASCKDKALCGSATVQSTYMVVCSECCDSNLCSASSCNQQGFNTSQGSICYHCDYPVNDPLQCDKIKTCSVDEVCGIHRTPHGQYQLECENVKACAVAQSLGTCSLCCSSDLCNQKCIPTTTSIPPVTTASSCVDHKDCQTLISTLGASGQDICLNTNLNQYCNSTCGLCPGQTSRVPQVTSTSTIPSATSTVGIVSTTAADPCKSNPCLHGTCVPIMGSYFCACQPHYTGTTCGTLIDPCSRSPCVHGTCSPSGTTYSCACTPGYTGPTCASVQNKCLPNPCGHGSCTQSGTSFSCNCNTGYVGPLCNKVDSCLSNPCLNGQCVPTAGGYLCSCQPNYTGTNCATKIDPCLPNPCIHGRCASSGTGFTCSCNTGYTGTLCSSQDPCSLKPCIHGTCFSQPSGGYRCTCQPGYTGAACDTDIDECLSHPCVHGSCRDNVNGYTCSCSAGYTDQQCSTDINDCAPVNPCVHGTCKDKVNGYNCTCASGYKGTRCDQLVKLRDCKDIQDTGNHHGDGMYRLDLSQQGTSVKCDMTTDGGGWTVILERHSISINFEHKDSTDYAVGFGNKQSGDFWQGLEDMHLLTADGRRHQLRVEMVAANGTHYYEAYDDFWIGSARNFQLHIGNYRGTAGDSLSNHNNYGFTTTDHDVDDNGINCAGYLRGAWWFHNCYDSCLTCPYISGATPGTIECSSMSWNAIRYCEPLRSARMMVRPM